MENIQQSKSEVNPLHPNYGIEFQLYDSCINIFKKKISSYSLTRWTHKKHAPFMDKARKIHGEREKKGKEIYMNYTQKEISNGQTSN